VYPKLIVALDYDNFSDATALINQLEDSVDYYKVGLELFLATGFKVVDYLKSREKRVFLDLKMHDIPNTVSKALSVAVKSGVDILTIHTQGGMDMMKQARVAVDEISDKCNLTCKPLLVGITLLTSLDKDYLHEYNISVVDEISYVKLVALKAKVAGLDGVVSSANEVVAIKDCCGKDFITITPGIRLQDENIDDQKRIVTPTDAKRLGSDFIVVGRSITSSSDPKLVAVKIINLLSV